MTSVVVGTRTAQNVASTMRRYQQAIPEAFWDTLAQRGLVRGLQADRDADR